MAPFHPNVAGPLWPLASPGDAAPRGARRAGTRPAATRGTDVRRTAMAPFHPNVAGVLVASGVARRRRAAWSAASGHKVTMCGVRCDRHTEKGGALLGARG